MDLKSGKLYWPQQNPPPIPRAPLAASIQCDAAVLGAGLSGAAIAQALAAEGIDTVLLDKRDVAQGSTSASTALILYEIDLPLFRLIQMRGQKAAVRSYQLCREAIDQIARTVSTLNASCRFHRRPSLQFAARPADLPALHHEFAIRSRFGFELDFLLKSDVENLFSFSSPGALLSKQAAEIDPFFFTQSLVQNAELNGARTFVRTSVEQIHESRDSVLLRTRSGHRIKARRVIIAAGYESKQFFRQKLVTLKSSFVLVTKPAPHFQGWHQRSLIWDTARPYHYLRTTADHRLMIGGGDADFSNTKKRDALIPSKSHALLGKLQRLFPHLHLEPEFFWGGTFGETKDGLPYIDHAPRSKRIFLALCYGANGTNFAMLAATLARDWLLQRPNPDASLFTLSR